MLSLSPLLSPSLRPLSVLSVPSPPAPSRRVDTSTRAMEDDDVFEELGVLLPLTPSPATPPSTPPPQDATPPPSTEPHWLYAPLTPTADLHVRLDGELAALSPFPPPSPPRAVTPPPIAHPRALPTHAGRVEKKKPMFRPRTSPVPHENPLPSRLVQKQTSSSAIPPARDLAHPPPSSTSTDVGTVSDASPRREVAPNIPSSAPSANVASVARAHSHDDVLPALKTEDVLPARPVPAKSSPAPVPSSVVRAAENPRERNDPVSLKEKRAREARLFPKEVLSNLDGTTSAEVRKMNATERELVLFKRKLRNRESARRSRQKRQAALADLQEQVDDLMQVSSRMVDLGLNLKQENDRLREHLSRTLAELKTYKSRLDAPDPAADVAMKMKLGG